MCLKEELEELRALLAQKDSNLTAAGKERLQELMSVYDGSLSIDKND